MESNDNVKSGRKSLTTYENVPKKEKIKKNDAENSKKPKKMEKIKRHYFKTFYYSFSICFIIFGLMLILYFVYTQDKNIFGFAEKYFADASKYLKEDNYEKAEESLLKCLEIDPDYNNARLILSDVYMMDNKGQAAVDILKEGIILQPRNELFYGEVVKSLTSQNRISEAIDFFAKISSSYIKVKLADSRPNNIISSPDPGTYDSAISVSFNIPENSEIYYTLDDTQPSTKSRKYDPANPIVIDKGTITIRAFVLKNNGMISDEYRCIYRIYNDNTQYLFVDEKMEQIVRNSIGRQTGAIYYRDLNRLTRLTNIVKGGEQPLTGTIKKLEDLEAMQNLAEIILTEEPDIISYNQLLSCKSLRLLDLSLCQINDTIAKQIFMVAWLETLRLNDNIITDISEINNMAVLKEFSIENNNVKDLSPLSQLSNLTKLNISKNLISDISRIGQISRLKSLNISNNLIYDISNLSALSLLTELDASNNRIKDLSNISRLSRIETLNISDNPISSLKSISGYNVLSNLKICGTDIVTLEPLKGMTTLSTLDLSRTNIYDYSAIENMYVKNLIIKESGLVNIYNISLIKSIEILDLQSNSINDVSSLTSLAKLKVVNISNNNIPSMRILVNCPSLELVYCSKGSISDSDKKELENKKITVLTQ